MDMVTQKNAIQFRRTLLQEDAIGRHTHIGKAWMWFLVWAAVSVAPCKALAFKLVNIEPGTSRATLLAVQACAGMYNREHGGSVYVRMGDKDSQWLKDLALIPDEILGSRRFLDMCLTRSPRCVRYSYERQQRLLPNILTMGAVLEAIPLDDTMEVECEDIVFDATVEFEHRNTPYLATKYVYDAHVNETTGLAMLNPGYDPRDQQVWDPDMTGDMEPSLIDFVFSKKLFVMFLVNGCIKLTREHRLLNDIARNNPWPKPIGVYGYSNSWMVLGGYVFEAQTLCSSARNMGAIPTAEVNNLSFFSSRREPIVDAIEIRQNALEEIDYDPNETYVAFVVGDGDNIAFIMNHRARWLRQRSSRCLDDRDACAPLTWTISPHLPNIAPDVLKWYYTKSRETGKDYFMLPPSGHLYAYPASMREDAQNRFVAATQRDAHLLGTRSTIDWEWWNTWRRAEKCFLPKYAKREGAIRGVFPVNVPYLLPTFTWRPNQFLKVLVGEDGGKVVLFRPREWRGVDGGGGILEGRFRLTPENMAKELGEYPRGTVSYVYMTSDGGLNLENSFRAMLKELPTHVHLVSADTAVRLALEASGESEAE